MSEERARTDPLPVEDEDPTPMPASDAAENDDAPGVVLVLLQLSDSMREGMAHRESMTKLRAARVCVDYALKFVVEAHESRGKPGPIVAVVGYSTDEGDQPPYRTLLPGTDEKAYWVDAEKLAAAPIRLRKDGPPHWIPVLPEEKESRRWIDAKPEAGVRMTAAFGLAHRLIRQKLAEGSSGGPVLLIHCGDGLSADGLPDLEARSLLALTAADRRQGTVLMNCIFHDVVLPSVGVPPGDSSLRQLWEISSPVPGPDGEDHRAFSINKWPKTLLRRLLSPQGRPALPAPSTSPPVPELSTRALKLAKKGNTPDQWEDAFEADPVAGVVAVCDGAGEGIFVKAWANILCHHFVFDKERARLERQVELAEWLRPLRSEWIKKIGYPEHLNWSQKRKVPEVGGASTFLGLEVVPAPEAGAGDGADPLAWSAVAVGDTCLFLIRDGRLLLSFPMIASCDFGRAPSLLRTIGQAPVPNPLVAVGRCRPGDLFILGTDAVSQWLFRLREEGRDVDWSGLWDADQDAWAAEIESERKARRIVNDDCTLVLVRVGPGAAPDRTGGRVADADLNPAGRAH